MRLIILAVLFGNSSDEEDEDLNQKDNILPKNRKRKRHDIKKKVSYQFFIHINTYISMILLSNKALKQVLKLNLEEFS